MDIYKWRYNIEIKNIKKTYNINSTSITAEMSMWYIFNEHSFNNFKIKIVRLSWYNITYEIDWKYIELIPNKISHKEFEKKLENLWYYLQEIRKNYNSSATNLKIDLNLWKVFIDSNSFNVIINKE